MLRRRLVQFVLYETRLHARRPRLGIERHEPVHVLREVEHDCVTDGLAGEARATAAR